MKKPFLILCAILFITVEFTACDNAQHNMDNGADENALLRTEQKNPEEYLIVMCKWTNMIGSDTVNGSVLNLAKEAEFKDVKVKINFISVDGNVVGSDVVTVQEAIPAGKKVTFTQSCDPPRNTFKATAELVSAKANK